MSTPTTPKRRARTNLQRGYSPPTNSLDDAPGTPGPIKARINNLNGQVQELVRKQHATERKHRAEMMLVERRLEESRDQVSVLQETKAEDERQLAKVQRELERCKTEGDGMRTELNLHSLVQQQKALLALSEEKLQLCEMEERLLQGETARLIRDHKLSLFQTREHDLTVEIDEKDARMAELEQELASANTSLAHQRAAAGKAEAFVSSTRGESRAEVAALEARVSELEEANAALHAAESQALASASKFEDKARSHKEKEREARSELARVKAESMESTSTSSDEVTELRAQLRAAKAEAFKALSQAADAAEELDSFKETSKEKEKALKAKYREAHEERLKLAGVEEELEALKAASAKPAKKETTRKKAVAAAVDDDEAAPKKKRATRSTSPDKAAATKKDKARKTSPMDSGSEDEAPKKKAKKPASKSKALRESDSSNKDDTADAGAAGSDSDVPPAAKEEAAVPEKKKKRKLFGAQPPAFTWDPIMSSGDGVIPTFLSPVKPGGRAVGTIPRSLSARRF